MNKGFITKNNILKCEKVKFLLHIFLTLCFEKCYNAKS